MVKLVAFFKRKPGVSVDEFQRHWRTRHAQLVVRQDGLRRYVQNHVLPGAYRRGEPLADGVAEAWFDDVDAMRRLAPSAEYAAVRADEERFLDAGSMRVLLTDEVVILDGEPPPGAVKLLTFLHRRPGLAPEAFQRHWREVHAPLGAAVPEQRRYVQCHARLGVYASGRTPPCDGIAMAWFADVGAMRRAADAPEVARMRADEPAFLAPGPAPTLVAGEIEIDCRPRA